MTVHEEQAVSQRSGDLPERAGRNRKAILLAAAALIASLALHGVVGLLWPNGFVFFIDIDVYQAGGRALVHGASLYDGPLVQTFNFTYTPAAAIVFVPLAFLPATVLHLGMAAVNLVAVFGAAWFAGRIAGIPAGRKLAVGAVVVASIALWLEPVHTTLWLGQINLVLLVLVLWDFSRSDGARTKGIAIGIAAGIKLTPVIFIVYLLVTRRFRAAAVAAGTFAATIAAGFVVAPHDAARYWGGVFLDSSRIAQSNLLPNQSINGMLARIAPSGSAPTVLWLALAAIVFLIGIALARRAHAFGHELLAVGMVGVLGTAISPFSWGHHWVYVIPLVVFCWHYATTISKAGWWLGALVCLLTLAWLMSFPSHDDPYGPSFGLYYLDIGAWPGQYVYQNAYLFVDVAVLVFTAFWLRARRSAAGTDPAKVEAVPVTRAETGVSHE